MPKRIDSHNHPDWHGHNLPRFLENMAACRIDRTWLLTWIAPRDEYAPSYYTVLPQAEDGPIPFSRCLAYAAAEPEKFVLGYAPDPRRPEAIDRLQAAMEIYGVRVYGELKLRMMYDNPDALRVFRFCGDHNLPVVVHIDYEFDTGATYPRPNWWYGGGIEAFERALKGCPGTTFIGHAPGFWSHISADDQFDRTMYPTGRVMPGGRVVQLFQTYSNLYADLSANSARNALRRDTAFARDFILEFQDRLLYARDGFGQELQDLLTSLELPNEVLEKVYAGNALRLVPDKEESNGSSDASA